MGAKKVPLAIAISGGVLGIAGALAFAAQPSLISMPGSTQSGAVSPASVLTAVRDAQPDPSLPKVVATVNGQPITRLELAQAEEVIGHGQVRNPFNRTREEAALSVLIDTVVVEQTAKDEGLDPTVSEAKAHLQAIVSNGGSFPGTLSAAGISPDSYVRPEMVNLYRLAAGRAALEAEVTFGLPASKRSAAWSNYVSELVNSATIVKFGGL